MLIQLIYNPHSGGGRGGKLTPTIIQSLSQDGHMIIEHCTLYRNHAAEIAKNIDMPSCDAIVIIGGDGTAYEVLNGMMNNRTSKERPPIGIIPVGTGNSFAKDLGMQHWKDGILAVNRAVKKPVDIMKFITEGDTFYSMNSIGFGLPADVSISGMRWKKLFGEWSYTLCAVAEILRFKPHDTRLEVDGKVYEFEGAFTNFSNSVYFGGNMKISPNSVIDDGKIEAVVLEDLKKGELLQALPTVYRGEHLSNPYVKVYQGKHFRVETVPPKICNPEGEIFGVTPLEITVMPREIEFFIRETQGRKREKPRSAANKPVKTPAKPPQKSSTEAKKPVPAAEKKKSPPPAAVAGTAKNVPSRAAIAESMEVLKAAAEKNKQTEKAAAVTKEKSEKSAESKAKPPAKPAGKAEKAPSPKSAGTKKRAPKTASTSRPVGTTSTKREKEKPKSSTAKKKSGPKSAAKASSKTSAGKQRSAFVAKKTPGAKSPASSKGSAASKTSASSGKSGGTQKKDTGKS